MSEKKNVRVLQLLIIILGICLVGLGFYTYSFYQDNKESTAALQQQNKRLQQELQGMKADYQKMIVNNKALKQNLQKEQHRITVLVDSLKNMEDDFELLRKYSVQADLLKIEKKRLSGLVDSLAKENQSLQSEIDSTTNILENHKKYTDSLSAKNIALAEKVEKASVLQLTNLQGEAVIIRNNKEVVATNKARKAEKMRVCFTLNENPVIEPGKRALHIQIINPKNNLLGEKKSVQYGEEILSYSATHIITYENKTLDVCVLINAARENLKEGRYIINVFDGANRMATSSFTLK